MTLINRIAILLSTYNGEEFIEEFLISLLQQTNQDYTLFIRDDGSTDGTIEIIHEFANKYANVQLVETEGNKGSKQSFSILSEYVLSNFTFDYFMFADQDDVWLPNKIQKSFIKMKEMENRFGNIALLVHTNLKVVDSRLNLLSESFWKYQNLNPHLDGLNRLLMQNVITGCTLFVNRKLVEIGLPIPQVAIMHDWWLSLVASAFGEIGYIQEPSILYRQHSANTLGAKKFDLIYFMKKMMNPITIEKNIMQCKQFYDTYRDNVLPYQKVLLLKFLKLSEVNFFIKILIIIKFKFYKNGFIRNIGLLLKIR
jgi:glycosyltransferase involved in cell wall biosynthesis